VCEGFHDDGLQNAVFFNGFDEALHLFFAEKVAGLQVVGMDIFRVELHDYVLSCVSFYSNYSAKERLEAAAEFLLFRHDPDSFSGGFSIAFPN
jgi:hypothetical protein